MRTKITDKRIDIIIGRRLKYLRMQKNLTQKALGDAVKVTTQQIQKYEQGQNRISVSRLYDITNFLQIPIKKFFEDESTSYQYYNKNILDFNISNPLNRDNVTELNYQDAIKDTKNNSENLSTSKTSNANNHIEDLESMRLLHAYNNIQDRRLRSSIYYLIKFLAKQHNDQEQEEEDDNKDKLL